MVLLSIKQSQLRVRLKHYLPELPFVCHVGTPLRGYSGPMINSVCLASSTDVRQTSSGERTPAMPSSRSCLLDCAADYCWMRTSLPLRIESGSFNPSTSASRCDTASTRSFWHRGELLLELTKIRMSQPRAEVGMTCSSPVGRGRHRHFEYNALAPRRTASRGHPSKLNLSARRWPTSESSTRSHPTIPAISTVVECAVSPPSWESHRAPSNERTPQTLSSRSPLLVESILLHGPRPQMSATPQAPCATCRSRP